MRFQTQKGFTLLELMIGVAIVAALATIAIPSYRSFIRDATVAEGVSLLGSLWRAQEEFRQVSGGLTYSQCFEGGTPLICARPQDQSNASTSANTSNDVPYLPPFSFIPPANSRFNLIVGNAGLESGSARVATTDYLEPEEREQRWGYSSDERSWSQRYGYSPDGPSFWMGAEALVRGEREVLAMRDGNLVWVCEQGKVAAGWSLMSDAGFEPPQCSGSSGDDESDGNSTQ